jgi:hypothetical protein
MTKIVDIDEFIGKLQKRKCDYWSKKNDEKKHYGLPVEQVIEVMLDSLDESHDSWARMDPEPILRQLFQFFKDELERGSND